MYHVIPDVILFSASVIYIKLNKILSEDVFNAPSLYKDRLMISVLAGDLLNQNPYPEPLENSSY